jgi:hypothetical protein
MTFRNLLLTIGCAAVVLVSPPARTIPRSASASVVWGACTSWSTWRRIPSVPGTRTSQRFSPSDAGRNNRE